MADAADLKSAGATRVGSNPTPATINLLWLFDQRLSFGSDSILNATSISAVCFSIAITEQ
mgnify:CR=1 FL=1